MYLCLYENEKGPFMEELDRAYQEQLYISAYWPQRTQDELHIGYGVAKDLLIYQGITILFTLATRVFGMFFESKLRFFHPFLRFVFMLVINILMTTLTMRRRKLSGFYQLDAQGKPTVFISKSPPESIRGHIGVGRKKFLNVSL
jgi:hypothetical protein